MDIITGVIPLLTINGEPVYAPGTVWVTPTVFVTVTIK